MHFELLNSVLKPSSHGVSKSPGECQRPRPGRQFLLLLEATKPKPENINSGACRGFKHTEPSNLGLGMSDCAANIVI